LPFCQRCTGLYVGACVATVLHLWLRPSMSGRFLGIHAGFLLAMAPFGFHWVAQGPVLRTLTGVLFGFAVITFLWLPLKARAEDLRARGNGTRERDFPQADETPALLWVGATLLLLPTITSWGGTIAAYTLSGLAFCGALALVTLIVANSALGFAAVVSWLGRAVRLRRQP
jgi:hypothetical protein